LAATKVIPGTAAAQVAIHLTYSALGDETQSNRYATLLGHCRALGSRAAATRIGAPQANEI
jgi:hypothetical protein